MNIVKLILIVFVSSVYCEISKSQKEAWEKYKVCLNKLLKKLVIILYVLKAKTQ